MNSIPTHLVTEVFIVKDLLVSSLTSLLNVNSLNTLDLLKNLDDRINTGKITCVSQMSFQVNNAYTLYLKYLPLLDSEQFNKYPRE